MKRTLGNCVAIYFGGSDELIPVRPYHVVAFLRVGCDYSRLVRIGDVLRDRNVPTVGGLDPLCDGDAVGVQAIVRFVSTEDER